MKNKDRFTRALEKALLWGNGIGRTQLSLETGLSIITIQRFIDGYIAANPGKIYYCRKAKAYLATEDFSPTFIRGDSEDYLQFVLGEKMQQKLLSEEINLDHSLPVEDARSLIISPVDDNILEKVIKAINAKTQITGTYKAKAGVRKEIILSPHSIALARNRYHVRAYNHQKQVFLDYVIGRFESVRVLQAQQEWVSSSDDIEWQASTTLIFELNPELSEDEKESFRYEWNLSTLHDQKTITTRKALAKYIKEEMNTKTVKAKHKTWNFIEEK